MYEFESLENELYKSGIKDDQYNRSPLHRIRENFGSVFSSFEWIISKVRERAFRQGFYKGVRCIRKAYKKQNGIKVDRYPEIPLPVFGVEGGSWSQISHKPGVYFIWNQDRIVYVGLSDKSICQRVSTPYRPEITKYDAISFLEFEDDRERGFAEMYYIGLLQPERNHPSRKSNKAKAETKAAG